MFHYLIRAQRSPDGELNILIELEFGKSVIELTTYYATDL